ncbi:MAG: 4-hydroxybutyrate CoA-transferase [Chloroflexi bacterium]|nr:4-hydroxybutyrate CoA-transferase [Chloroflexota bacterium]
MTQQVSAREAIAQIRPGSTILIGESCGEPQTLIEALVADKERLKGSRIIECRRITGSSYAPLCDYFHITTMHVTPDYRDAVHGCRADFLPIRLAEAHAFFQQNPVDVALVQVSPPASRKLCSFSVAVGFTYEAARAARMIIAEVNDRMPWSYGQNHLGLDHLDYIVPSSRPVLAYPSRAIEEEELAVAHNVARLVPDGAVLSIGIGGISEAVLTFLAGKKDLGIHSGIITDGVIELMKSGVISNRTKPVDRGKTVAALAFGTERLFDFMDRNPAVRMQPFSYTHDVRRISRFDNYIAVNSAVEVDLTGQVNAESVGSIQISTIGGQADFARGAALSRGGKSVITLTSTTRNSKGSKIVPVLKAGGVVSTPRYDVHCVVTEYGVAELWGKTVKQRVNELISVAHPGFRDELRQAARRL